MPKKSSYFMFAVVLCLCVGAFGYSRSKVNFELKSQYSDEEQPYFFQMKTACYTGWQSEVYYTIRKMMDNKELQRDQGIQAVRFGKSKIITSEDQFFETSEMFLELHEAENPAVVKAWFNYDTSSKDVLVISDLGPQGDGMEVYSTVVEPCK